ncbi:hypothetical protein KQI68_06925 [Peptoniphilus sp. MSJ-1]|uniref:Uncharacterized protein n=1 Tax=Peptoniphilus ovalis TaxID=2841503 RepID=A0ABS6FJ90_9FIRM|nr:hypothetical protein [Peptoniphilus ovalis]MBU5669572.1 hypothetical protein [Peptoniphilus ovalis]
MRNLENLNDRIKEVKTYTLDNKKFYSTKQELIEDYKKQLIQEIIESCLNNVFDYDKSFYIEQTTKNLMNKIDDIINIYETNEI